LRIFSAAAPSVLCALPATAHERSAVVPTELPPVTVASPDHQHPKRLAHRNPPKSRGTHNRTAARSDSPTEGGVAAGAAPDGRSALQPTAADPIAQARPPRSHSVNTSGIRRLISITDTPRDFSRRMSSSTSATCRTEMAAVGAMQRSGWDGARSSAPSARRAGATRSSTSSLIAGRLLRSVGNRNLPRNERKSIRRSTQVARVKSQPRRVQLRLFMLI
jgi:hypothetical protein